MVPHGETRAVLKRHLRIASYLIAPACNKARTYITVPQGAVIIFVTMKSDPRRPEHRGNLFRNAFDRDSRFQSMTIGSLSPLSSFDEISAETLASS